MSRPTHPLTPITSWGRVSGRIARLAFWPVAGAMGVLGLGGLVFGMLWMALAALMLVWPVAAAAVRRLHDGGFSGRWLALMAVPPLAFVPLVMLLWPRSHFPARFSSLNDSRLPALALALVCLGAVALTVTALPLRVTSAAMKPGLIPGDIVLNWRFSYGVQPHSCYPLHCPRAQAAPPARGDVVAFLRPDGAQSFARVIGLPGDEVSLEGGVPVVNGYAAAQTQTGALSEPFLPFGPNGRLPRCINGAVGLGARCDKTQIAEVLRAPDGSEARYPVLDLGPSALDTFAPVRVPPGAVFVLSDNRDAGSDSRTPPAVGGTGMVAIEGIIARSARVLWSQPGRWWQVWKLRPDRIMVKVI